MKYSILIVNYNLKESIIRLIESLRNQFSSLPASYEILIFDNLSQDGSRDYFENQTLNSVKYIYSNQNLGFGAAMNRLSQNAQGEILILLNPDLEIPVQSLSLPVWIEKTLTAERVLIAPALVGTDLKPQANGGGTSGTLTFILQALRMGQLVRTLGLVKLLSGIFQLPVLRSSRYAKYFANFSSSQTRKPEIEKYDWVSGAFWVLRRKDFLNCRGFDENIFLYCEDEDLCRRLKQQTRLEIIKSDAFYAIHAVGGTQAGQQRFSRSRLERLNSNIYFLRKWNGSLSAATLRIFYFLYFLAFARLKYSIQAISGLKISDSSGTR